MATKIRFIAATSLALASPRQSLACHGDPVMVPAPEYGAAIPRNAWIRLQSYNGIDLLVQQLAPGGPAQGWLVAPGDEVALMPVRFHDDQEGGYGDGVLVLRPARLLRAGYDYRLKVRYRSDDGPEEWVSEGAWKVGEEIRLSEPMWRGEPRYVPGRGEDDPTVRVALVPQDLVELVATFTPEDGGARPFSMIVVFDRSRWCREGSTVDYTTAVVRSHCPGSEEGEPDLTCEYASRFDTGGQAGHRYRLELTAVDIAGHAERAPGGPIGVRWPRSMRFGFCWRGWTQTVR